MIKIRNNEVIAEITVKGASLESITVDGKSILWNKDATWWNRVAPFLFPIVGRLLDNEYSVDGKTYPLSQHGFLRDSDFSVEDQTETACTLKFMSNDKTREVYPFDFEVIIAYTLLGRNLLIDATIVNAGETDMYYSFGYHPAFIVESKDAYIELQGPKPFKQYTFDGPYCNGETEFDGYRVDFDMMTYENMTLVFEEVHRVILHDGKRKLAMDVRSYPHLGIWTPTLEDGTQAPFVCLEPWAGFGDRIDHDKILNHKFGIEKIEPQSQKNWSTTIEV
ncbi:hypothetical protein AOC36_07995 [Erysipelothrix larvae]|uniref:Aldose epimerase n=1 Tax=Erysipelothrix larvae TaxID=1514105 RepID=A0A109UHA0_9FIRM|nr:hypothetical protein [Erysipelothrix larvae]AMC93928.1 hypothetical protein AOC36_07995 [Erysipelothrix larvae]